MKTLNVIGNEIVIFEFRTPDLQVPIASSYLLGSARTKQFKYVSISINGEIMLHKSKPTCVDGTWRSDGEEYIASVGKIDIEDAEYCIADFKTYQNQILKK